jgi:serine/threonine protein phosphatase PrpC
VAERYIIITTDHVIINRMRKVSIIIYQQGNPQPQTNHYITTMYHYGLDW